jgi:hypothetical protein
MPRLEKVLSTANRRSQGLLVPCAGICPQKLVSSGVQDDIDARLEHCLDRSNCFLERFHLVLEVAADHTGGDGSACRFAGIAVPGLEVHAVQQINRFYDAAHHVQVQLKQDALTVFVSEAGGNRVARGGQGGGARCGSDDVGGDDIPDVGQGQDLRCGVQLEEDSGLRELRVAFGAHNQMLLEVSPTRKD